MAAPVSCAARGVDAGCGMRRRREEAAAMRGGGGSARRGRRRRWGRGGSGGSCHRRELGALRGEMRRFLGAGRDATRGGAHEWGNFWGELSQSEVRSSIRASQSGQAERHFCIRWTGLRGQNQSTKQLKIVWAGLRADFLSPARLPNTS